MKTKMLTKNQKGGAIVEFAIVLPLLVLLVMGTVEFGLMYYNNTNASREGARSGIVRNSSWVNDNDKIKQIVKDYANSRLIDFNNTTLIDDDIFLDPDTRGSFGDDFSVTITYDYGFLLPSIFGLETTTPIRAKTLMKMEGTT